MPLWLLITLIVIAAVVGGLLIFYFAYVRKMQQKSDEQQEQVEETKESYEILTIDKKKMPLIEAGFPKVVIDGTPKRYRKKKVPVVKAKIGPKVVTLIADKDVFDQIPLKSKVKVEISGIFIVKVYAVKGGKPLETKKKKK